MRWTVLLAATMAGGLILSGCGPGEEDAYTPPRVGKIPDAPPIVAAAGLPVPNVPDPTFNAAKAEALAFSPAGRRDVFALVSSESRFEQQQASARLTQEFGQFELFYAPPPPPPEELAQFEPQPYRRLAGIVVGDAVLALIEMEDGRVYDVRPGSRIPNSEWRVVSIDAEKAVLRRGGDKLPREITVRLESRPPGMGGPGGGGGAGGGGDQEGPGGRRGEDDAPGVAGG